ncbi:uncharacterized protein FN964_003737 [Alca torda]
MVRVPSGGGGTALCSRSRPASSGSVCGGKGRGKRKALPGGGQSTWRGQNPHHKTTAAPPPSPPAPRQEDGAMRGRQVPGRRGRDSAPGGGGGSAPLLSLSSSLARTASLLRQRDEPRRRGAAAYRSERSGEEGTPPAPPPPPAQRPSAPGAGCEGEAPLLPQSRYKCPSAAAPEVKGAPCLEDMDLMP